METMADFIFLGSKITTDGDCIIMVIVAMKLKDTSWEKSYHSTLKGRDITLPTKVYQSYSFSSSHVTVGP